MENRPAEKKANSILPAALRTGNMIGLISPASAISDLESVQVLEEHLATLGLQVKRGVHLFDRYGYLAGSDEERAADIHAMFADPSVQAIIAMRGGWGCNRLLPFLNYDFIRAHPKAIIGYSDITALLIALYTKSGLVAFHGPLGISTWGSYTRYYFKRVLFEGEMVRFQNPMSAHNEKPREDFCIKTITPGKSRGVLIGGNLAVLSSMVGSDYLPDWQGKILFLEEINEKIYRVDRMLTQLKLAGILNQIAGFIFGQCTSCDDCDETHLFTLGDILAHHIQPLGIPAWYGSMIGHIPEQFTLPIGCEVEIDAHQGSIRMLERAVI